MDNMAIGQKIKELRKNNKITQQELAEKIGRTESSIRKYEKGIVEIPLNVLSQIADALNVNVSALIPEAPKIQLVPNQEKIVKNLLTISERTIKESDPYYDIRSQAQALDMVNSILDIAKTDTSFWEEVAPLDDETLARYFKAIMTTIGLSGVISMHDKDIKTLLLSDEFKHFIDLLMLKYDTSKDSDN